MRVLPEFADWDGFYLIIGSAAGTLIGLQFVAMTLISQKPPKGVADAGAAFSSPTVVHFVAALFVAALSHVPWPTIVPPAVGWGLTGAIGVFYVVAVVRRMRRQSVYKLVLEDWLFHFALPLAAYAALAVSALAATSAAGEALFAVAAAAFVLLLVGIHNAWDSVAYHVLVVNAKNDGTTIGNQGNRASGSE